MKYNAIPTIYKGVRFKSRLEADMAYLLDFLELSWQYEPQSFLLDNGVHYLPDFFLPQTKTWIECRGYDTEKGNRQIDGFSKWIEEGRINGKTVRGHCSYANKYRWEYNGKCNSSKTREFYPSLPNWFKCIDGLTWEEVYNLPNWSEIIDVLSELDRKCHTCHHGSSNYVTLQNIMSLFFECQNKKEISHASPRLVKCQYCDKYYFDGTPVFSSFSYDIYECRHCGEEDEPSEVYDIGLNGKDGIYINDKPFRHWIEKKKRVLNVINLYFKNIKDDYKRNKQNGP